MRSVDRGDLFRELVLKYILIFNRKAVSSSAILVSTAIIRKMPQMATRWRREKQSVFFW